MKKLIPVIMVAMLLVVACGSSVSVEGKWYHEDDDGSYVELTGDGNVIVGFPDYEGGIQTMEVGTYEVSGNTVEMLLWGEERVTGVIEGSKMTTTDSDGVEDIFHRR